MPRRARFGRRRALAAVDGERRKEVRDLDARRLGTVRAVYRVGIDRFGEIRADRSRRSLLRVGRPHQVAVLRDRGFALEYLDHHRAGRHEFDQILEKGALPVHRVKTLGLDTREVAHLGGHDPEPVRLEA